MIFQYVEQQNLHGDKIFVHMTILFQYGDYSLKHFSICSEREIVVYTCKNLAYGTQLFIDLELTKTFQAIGTLMTLYIV